MTLLADVVAASATATATRSRTAKIAALADVLARVTTDELAATVGFLCGAARQGRIGVGWATVSRLAPATAATPSLEVGDLDRLVDEVAQTTGSGSAAARDRLLGAFLTHATAEEADFVRRLFVGELRQGALEGLVTDAVAKAAGVPASTVRRALMLAGDLGEVAVAARTGGVAALDAIGLQVGRPLRPMLAATSPDVATAVAELGEVSVEWKLDGARIQVHRAGDDVRIVTRNLNDVTGRLPEVVDTVRAFATDRFVLDGELVGWSEADADAASGPSVEAFQDTMSRFGTRSGAPPAIGLRPFFFDVLHVGGDDLVDAPLAMRRRALETTVGPLAVPALVTADADTASAFSDAALAAGHEGVMVKALDSRYEAGRRGKAWRKVKPVRTFDLVVLAAEWGHGRRTGWLSNLHLGARDPDDPGRFVMVGKTFKGLTDALLTWQTAALLERRLDDDGWVVHVRPELVVEIALDGVQRSTRYPGGVALRFARVKRYRADKVAAEADTITALQSLLASRE